MIFIDASEYRESSAMPRIKAFTISAAKRTMPNMRLKFLFVA